MKLAGIFAPAGLCAGTLAGPILARIDVTGVTAPANLIKDVRTAGVGDKK